MNINDDFSQRVVINHDLQIMTYLGFPFPNWELSDECLSARAMKLLKRQITITGKGPQSQYSSVGCSIKWSRISK
jgi:hypothetical protein